MATAIQAPPSIKKFVKTITSIQEELSSQLVRSLYETVLKLLSDETFKSLPDAEKRAFATAELSRVKALFFAEIEAEVAATVTEDEAVDIEIDPTMLRGIRFGVRFGTSGTSRSVLRVLLKDLVSINFTDELIELAMTDRPDEVTGLLKKLLDQGPVETTT